MTRARQLLYLSRARRRHLFGTDSENPPSRFLKEIPTELLEVRAPRWDQRVEDFADEDDQDEPRRRSIDYSDSQEFQPTTFRDPPRFASPARARTAASFPVGTRVRHPTLGEGVVRATEGSGEREKVTVMFGGFGIRKLVVAVARLEAV
jgi:DNA helicase-2/ATP-dependent DNA helicase PcrA